MVLPISELQGRREPFEVVQQIEESKHGEWVQCTISETVG